MFVKATVKIEDTELTFSGNRNLLIQISQLPIKTSHFYPAAVSVCGLYGTRYKDDALNPEPLKS